MILHVMSDIHFEHMTQKRRDNFWADWQATCEQEASAGAVCILAGDIDSLAVHANNKIPAQRSLGEFADRYQTVICVPGNHEYHGTSFVDAKASILAIRSAQTSYRLNILRPGEKVYVDHVPFMGGTMWYPNVNDTHLEGQFCDFYLIKDSQKIYTSNDTFMHATLGQCSNDVIMVTHHLPFYESIAPQWQGSYLNPFFFNSRVEKEIKEEICPRLWIHGHTHNPIDYMKKIGKHEFRVYANPFGYPNERSNPMFWDRVKVEL
jgi:Icc-related predicted phosphoesterase